jgi:hypothetical protein
MSKTKSPDCNHLSPDAWEHRTDPDDGNRLKAYCPGCGDWMGNVFSERTEVGPGKQRKVVKNKPKARPAGLLVGQDEGDGGDYE